MWKLLGTELEKNILDSTTEMQKIVLMGNKEKDAWNNDKMKEVVDRKKVA